MTKFAVLRHYEAVSVDVDCLVQLYASAGEVGAEEIIVRTVDDIGTALSAIGRLAGDADYDGLSTVAMRVAVLAQDIGLTGIGIVALDVAETSGRADVAGLEATLARLSRVAHGALATVWDLHRAVR